MTVITFFFMNSNLQVIADLRAYPLMAPPAPISACDDNSSVLDDSADVDKQELGWVILDVWLRRD